MGKTFKDITQKSIDAFKVSKRFESLLKVIAIDFHFLFEHGLMITNAFLLNLMFNVTYIILSSRKTNFLHFLFFSKSKF